jgi:hypothetical protein
VKLETNEKTIASGRKVKEILEKPRKLELDLIKNELDNRKFAYY